MANTTYCIVSVQGVGVDEDATFIIPNSLVDVEMPVYLDLNRHDEFELAAPKLYDCITDVYTNGFTRSHVQKLSDTGELPTDIAITRFVKITNYD